MLQMTPHMRVLVGIEPADFRKGIDGMAALCRSVLQADPFDGTVFVFRNRRGTAIKLLVYDGRGFWLCHKRLSQGRFRHWPTADAPMTSLESHQLGLLLCGADPLCAQAVPIWRPVDGARALSPPSSASFEDKST